jgi:alpha-beta hydrolase superfamily lysophospholipase
VRKSLAVLTHLLLILTALRCSHSTSGFLLNGPALALLLDRYVLRLLPWKPIRWARETAVRGAYFLFGATAFALLRLGVVPWWEAVYRGALVSVAAFAVESALDLVVRPSSGWRGRVLPWLAALVLLGLLIPVAGALHPVHTVPKRPPSSLGLAFEDVRIETADGVRLAAWVVPHPQAHGNVLFCHGHGRNRGHLAALLPTVHELGLNVLALDFRGHGDSEGHTCTLGQDEIEDVLAAEAYLSRRFSGQPLFLVGVSLGADVCLRALPRLSNVAGVWSEGAFARLQGPVDNLFRPLPDLLRGPVVEGYAGLAWLDCGLRMRALNTVETSAGSGVPICFVHGCQDQLIPFSEAEALYSARVGPKEHWWVEDACHYNVRQRHPDEYAARLSSFIKSRLAEARTAR